MVLLFATACEEAPPGPNGNPTLIAPAGGIAAALAVDNDNVYWITQASTDTNGRLFKAPKLGGDAVELATDLRWPSSIVVDERNVYVVTADGLFKLPKHGGTPAQLVADGVSDVTIGRDSVYWSTGESISRAPSSSGTQTMVLGQLEFADVLAVDDIHIYWVNRLYGSLLRAQLDGAAVTKLGSIVGDISPALALDSANVYWGVNGYVSKVSKTDGAVTVLSGEYSSALRIWTDGRYLYTIRSTSDSLGEVRRMPVSGGNFVSVVENIGSANSASSLALDEAYLYWGDSAPDGVGATIRRAPK